MSRFVLAVLLVEGTNAFVPASAPSTRRGAPLSSAPLATVKVRTTTISASYGGGGFGGPPPGFGGPPPLGGGGGFNPRSLIGPVVFASLIASGALGWIFNGILFLTLIPLVAGPLFSWYVQSNLLEGACPECGSPVQLLKNQRGQCMTCGASMSSEVQQGVFIRDGSAARESGVVEVEVLVDDD